jgi:hypothetical protein
MMQKPGECEDAAFDVVFDLGLAAEPIDRVVHGRVSISSTPSDRSAIRESGGGMASRRYFPVSAPPARGENGVNAKSRSAQIDRTSRPSSGCSRLHPFCTTW